MAVTVLVQCSLTLGYLHAIMKTILQRKEEFNSSTFSLSLEYDPYRPPRAHRMIEFVTVAANELADTPFPFQLLLPCSSLPNTLHTALFNAGRPPTL
jgi:hypothetical protein